jgi:alpha-1,2-mannosyltransferase
VPSSDWEVRHSCLSAYYVAAQAVDRGANVYDSGLYSLPADKPGDKRKPRLLGPFRVDVYEYPPPFLLLPRALAVVAPDFPRFRPLWFGLTGAVVMLAMLFTARQLGPAAGTRALLLSPLLWAAVPSLSVLQKGNVQGMIIALAMAAMVLFQRRRFAAGGLLLAYATASKLFPGLLLVYLLARRQWLALAWTAGASAVLVSLTLLVLGWSPFAHFLDHLPGLVGGEAFPAFQNPAAIAINYSLPGLVFKVGLFGVPGASFGAAKVVGWIYTLVAVAVTVLVARQKVSDAGQPVIWLAILSVATLRSPFLPQAYAGFCTLWLLTLLAATSAPSVRTLGLIIATWLALNIFWPLDWAIDPRLLAAVTTIPQAVTIAVAAMALRRHGRTDPGAPQTNRSGRNLVVPGTTA